MTDRERARLSAVPDPPERSSWPLPPGQDLRRLFVPATTPTLPAVEVRAGCASSSVRGPGFSWFEAVATAGRVFLVVGDTVAEGLVAASVAAQLRGVVAQALTSGVGPEETLERLQRYATHTPHVAGSNVVVAAVDTRTGDTRICHRGHLPPMVLGRDGRPRSVPMAPTPPLGVPGEGGCADERLGDGETLLLFSNALVDRSTGMVDARLRRLRREVASDPPTRLAETVSAVLSHRLRDARGRSGDATVVAARFRTEAAAAFRRAGIRSPADQRAARLHLRTWLHGLGLGDDAVFGLEQAVAAALAHLGNTVHAGSACEVDADAALGTDGMLEVTLRHACSTGPADTAPSSRRDEGLALGLIPMLHLVDEMDVQHPGGGSGTVVLLRQSVSAPTLFEPEGPATTGDPALPLEVSLRREGGRRVLLVSGPLRPDTLEDLRLALAATPVGPGPVALDLTDVTEMGGAGLGFLHRLVRGGAVELRAAAGTPASSVLRSSALPFEVSRVLAR